MVRGLGAEGLARAAARLAATREPLTRAQIRRRIGCSLTGLGRALDTLRWKVGATGQGDLARHLLLCALGALRAPAARGAATLLEAGTEAAQRYVRGLGLPPRERHVLAGLLDPSRGSRAALQRDLGRGASVLRKTVRKLQVRFDAPGRGQLVRAALHDAIDASGGGGP